MIDEDFFCWTSQVLHRVSSPQQTPPGGYRRCLRAGNILHPLVEGERSPHPQLPGGSMPGSSMGDAQGRSYPRFTFDYPPGVSRVSARAVVDRRVDPVDIAG